MKAAFYERQGPAGTVLTVGEMPVPVPGPGLGGSIATYATGGAQPPIPFWSLVFKNARVFFLGSDDFPAAEKQRAALALTQALLGGWPGFEIGLQPPLDEIAEAHLAVEERRTPGRVVIVP